MKLAQLLKSVPGIRSDVPDLDIAGIQEDSRKVRPGELFIARSGTVTDGSDYVRDAQSAGAAAAIVSSPVASATGIAQIVVDDPSAAISLIAHAFYNHPAEALKVIGITGTNGKTTTAYLIRDILRTIGVKCGMIGTVEIDDGNTIAQASMTTPSPIEVAAMLASMRDNGCGACAIEVSSHALDQKRVGAIRFAAGAFTNLTGDHLDYHKTMDAYASAKARLFEMLPASAAAIVNARDAAASRMVQATEARVRRFGIDQPADYRATDVVVSALGTDFTLHTPGGAALVKMKLIGRHNVENALTAAACVAETFSLTAEQIAKGLTDTPGAPGRLQVVDLGQPFSVLVDYAHTDDALVNVLTALRPLTRNKLRVVFGCGGDRDASKRPRMARVAEQLADAVYVTSDNPRTEDPERIIAAVCAGFLKTPCCVEPDRRSAIAKAIADAAPGDVVLIAGKGHENYQIVGKMKHHFDDVEEASTAIKGWEEPQ